MPGLGPLSIFFAVHGIKRYAGPVTVMSVT
jgi:hypothetical protein